MEIPYYLIKQYLPVCFYCGQDNDLVNIENSHPICKTCKNDNSKPVVKKCKRNLVSKKQNKKASTEANSVELTNN